MWVKMNQKDVNDFKRKGYYKDKLISFLFAFLISILFIIVVCFIYFRYDIINFSGSIVFFGIMLFVGVMNCIKCVYKFMPYYKRILKKDMFMCEAAVVFVDYKTSVDYDGDMNHICYLAVQVEDSHNKMRRCEVNITHYTKDRIKEGDIVRIVRFGSDYDNLAFYEKI